MLDPITLLSLWAPLAVVLIIFFGLCSYWLRKIRAAPNQKIEVDVDNFRQSINAALTVAGFIVPLLCGAIAYFAFQPGFAAVQLIPLLSATILFIASVFAGLWNIFSLTAANANKLELTEKRSGGFVAQFVIQLTLILFGFLVVGLYCLFFFDFKGGGLRDQTSSKAGYTYSLERPILSVGTLDAEVQAAWGNPDSTQIEGNATLRFYHGEDFTVILTSRAGTVEKMSIERKAGTP